MIAGNFMHLRHEHWRLTPAAAGSLLLTSVLLCAVLFPEAKGVRARSEAALSAHDKVQP